MRIYVLILFTLIWISGYPVLSQTKSESRTFELSVDRTTTQTQPLEGNVKKQENFLRGGANKTDEAEVTVTQYKLGKPSNGKFEPINHPYFSRSLSNPGTSTNIPAIIIPTYKIPFNIQYPREIPVQIPKNFQRLTIPQAQHDVDRDIENELHMLNHLKPRFRINSISESKVNALRVLNNQINAELGGSSLSPHIAIPDIKIPKNALSEDANLEIETNESVCRNSIRASLRQAQKEMDLELANAKRLTQERSKAASSYIEVAFSLQQKVPNIQSVPVFETPNFVDKEEYVNWDPWHSRFSQLLKPALLRAFREHGNPSGHNTVEVTVHSNYQVEATLIDSSDVEFTKATLDAYKALNGNPGLKFPAGTRKTKTSFYLNHKKNLGLVAGINCNPITGDTEKFYRNLQ